MCRAQVHTFVPCTGSYWDDSSKVYWENSEYVEITAHCNGNSETKVNLPQCCRPCTKYSGQVCRRGKAGGQEGRMGGAWRT